MIVAIVLLSVSVLMSPVDSEPGSDMLSVSLTAVDVSPGEDISVEVSIDSNPGIWALRLCIDYPEGFDLVSVDNTDLLDVVPGEVGNDPYVIYGESSDLQDVHVTGIVSTLRFHVSDGLEQGTYSMEYEVESINVSGEYVTVSVSGGTFTYGHVHEYDGGVVTKEPTETEAGLMTYTCGICGHQTSREIPVLSHTHDWSGFKVVEEATCEGPGVRESVCTKCGEVRTEEIPQREHSWDEPREVGASEDGRWNLFEYTCTECGFTKVVEVGSAEVPDDGSDNQYLVFIIVLVVLVVLIALLLVKRSR